MIPYDVGIGIGAFAAIVLTIVVYVIIMPKKNDGKFGNPFFQFLHDLFHFKKLFIGEILKFIYVLATVACETVGLFGLLGYQEYFYRGRESTFLYGLILMIAGPIVIRIAYEFIMMFILLIQNVIDINNKLGKKDDNKGDDPFATGNPFAAMKQPGAPINPGAPVNPVNPINPGAPIRPSAPPVQNQNTQTPTQQF